MKNKLIIFLILIANINIVSGESGSLIIDLSVGNSYGLATSESGTGQPDWNTFLFDAENYNAVTKFEFYTGTSSYQYNYAHESNSSRFTITVGGNGGGLAYYNKGEKKITWIFDSDTEINPIFVSTPTGNTYYFNVSYDDNFLYSDVTPVTVTAIYSGCTKSYILQSNTPMYIKSRNQEYYKCVAYSGYNFIAQTKKHIVNEYIIDYPSNGVFNFSIDKSSANVAQTKIEITNLTHPDVYLQETTYNNVSFSGASVYSKGIVIYMNDSVGNYDKVIVNSSSGIDEICTPSGNISTIKSNYNVSETVIINYNLTSCGYTSRLLIEDRNLLNQKTWIQIPIEEGNNLNYSWYIPENTPVGNLYLGIQYYAGGLFGYTSLNESIITISINVSKIEFQSDNYYLGDAIVINTFSYDNGYIQLLDSFNNIVLNKTINNNEYTKDFYFSTQNDNVGLYTVNLYNSSNYIVSTDTTYLSFKVVNQTLPTPTPTTTQIGLIDISNTLSTIVFGKIDNNDDNEISDDEIKTTGNKLFPTMLLLVIIILIMGAYNKLFRKK